MRFDIYGRYEVDIERVGDRWVAYRRGLGLRRPDPTIHIPDDLEAADLVGYLDDLLHEEGGDGRAISRLA